MAEGVVAAYSFPLSSWTVEQLKDYLKEHKLPVAGVKAELLERVRDCIDLAFFEDALDAKPFQHFHDENISGLPEGPWSKENFPIVSEQNAKDYLMNKGGYTKNYRTGVRLCQCGHLYDLETCPTSEVVYMRGKCRPTMRKNPAYYILFITLESAYPKGGNCSCAAGASQSCVHIAAMLFTLAEVTATSCTSVRCAWSRPSTKASASFSSELDFGAASLEGHFPYTGSKPPLDALLRDFVAAGSKPAFKDYLIGEEERKKASKPPPETSVDLLQDPIDILATVCTEREPIVDDLVNALRVTSEEAELIQIMTIGQRNNPLWMDARQWRITASTFGYVCNRNFRILYPPSLKKIILGDYGRPNTAAIQWGCDHEEVALKVYQEKMLVEVDVCGFFLCKTYPFLGATPDGLVYTSVGKFAILEIKCPYKHRNSTIVDACKDSKFCLQLNSLNQPILKRKHDYYYQITGQLGITSAEYCDFIVWTQIDTHIERIYFDATLWQEMTEKLKNYYYRELGPEIIHRLLQS